MAKNPNRTLIDTAVKRLYEANCQMRDLKGETTNLKETLQQYMQEKKVEEVIVEVLEHEVGNYPVKRIKAQLISKMSVVYDAEKLKENLDPEIYNEITEKVYEVQNIDLLKKLFKQAGLTPKQFKQCISSTTHISPPKIQQAYAVGDITKEDLRSAYTARIDKHIKVSSVK